MYIWHFLKLCVSRFLFYVSNNLKNVSFLEHDFQDFFFQINYFAVKMTSFFGLFCNSGFVIKKDAVLLVKLGRMLFC